MILRVLVLLVTLSFACPIEAASTGIYNMIGYVVNWHEGSTAGSFDLDVRGKLIHFQIDMKLATVDHQPVTRWARGGPSPFGTAEKPKHVCALVYFYQIGNYYREAQTITTLGQETSCLSHKNSD